MLFHRITGKCLFIGIPIGYIMWIMLFIFVDLILFYKK